MARPISDEELQLKKRARRRLVGAIVLVSIVAVVLPMVLDSEPTRVGRNVDIQIPSPDSGEFKPQASGSSASTSKAAPEPMPKPDVTAKAEPAAKAEVPAKPEATAAGQPDPAPSAPERTTPVETAQAPAKAAAADRPKEASTPKTAAKSFASGKKAESGSNGAYVVQVAALADPGKAKELEKRMAGAGVKTYTEVVTTNTGEVTRVRAGPYATREAAEKVRAQLKKAGLEGKIVPK